jgi:hypothetical protein
MQRKLLVFGLPALAIALVAGVGLASAASTTTTATPGVAMGGGPGPGMRGGMFGFGGFGGFNSLSPTDYAAKQAAEFKAEANALGLSESVIASGWASGQSLMQTALANGISTSTLATDLKNYQQTQLSAQLQALVSNGTITQDQMNARLAFEESRATQMQMSGKGHWPHGPPDLDTSSTTTQ